MSNKILLADADKKNLTVLGALIEEMYGIHPSVYPGSENSFNEFLNGPGKGVVFIRIDSTLIQGIELTRQAGGRYPDIHVVWMAAYEGYAIDAFPQGVDAYLLLPATREKLDGVMEALSFKRRRYNDTG